MPCHGAFAAHVPDALPIVARFGTIAVGLDPRDRAGSHPLEWIDSPPVIGALAPRRHRGATDCSIMLWKRLPRSEADQFSVQKPMTPAHRAPAVAALHSGRKTMPLILHNLVPIHWAVAGAGIAGVTLMLVLIANRRLGISTGFEDMCSLVLSQPYFRRDAVVGGRVWRLPLLTGLLLGGFLSAATGGGWAPTWSLGMLDTALGLGPIGKLAWMFVGGVFIGFGTRMAGGCTSGHGIFGLSNFEWPSLLSTLSFMGGGIVTTQIIYRVWLG